jgi:NADH-quinone oxidoreductase subunit G
LRKTESIDVMDGIGSNIRVDSRGREVMRILPRNHDGVNEEWISDKTRGVADGLKRRRLDRPYVRRGGKLEEVSWHEAFNEIAARVRGGGGKRIGAIAGDLAAVEEMFALKLLMAKLGSPHFDCRQSGAALHPAQGRASYLFNSTIAGIERADAVLLIGSNPRKEAAVLNARLRKIWLRQQAKIGLVGEKAALTFDYDHLGETPQTLTEIFEGKNAFAQVLERAKRPAIILGQAALARKDGAAIASSAAKIAQKFGGLNTAENWNGYNVLHSSAALAGGLDIGFVPGEGGLDVAGMIDASGAGDVETLFLLGADELDLSKTGEVFIIYQGSHGDRGARIADVILPGAAYTEKSGTYVNTEGRAQLAQRAIFPPGDAREDWTIIRALSEHLRAKLPFDSLPELRAALYKAHPHLGAIDQVKPGDAKDIEKLANQKAGPLSKEPFGQAVDDYYQTNPVARSSAVMAELTALSLDRAPGEATGTYA